MVLHIFMFQSQQVFQYCSQIMPYTTSSPCERVPDFLPPNVTMEHNVVESSAQGA